MNTKKKNIKEVEHARPSDNSGLYRAVLYFWNTVFNKNQIENILQLFSITSNNRARYQTWRWLFTW
jgi:hypothetical protein